MKGVIACCLADLVQTKFGKDKWETILVKSGLNPTTKFLCTQDIPDEAIMSVVQNTCDVLGITLTQAADAFGDYWVNDFATKVYKAYYPFYPEDKSAKGFLLNMDSVHKMVTRNVPNAHPPRFEYEWKSDNTLIMHYKSARGLVDFLVGLIKGVGRFYNEELNVTKLGPDKVEVVFLQATKKKPLAEKEPASAFSWGWSRLKGLTH